MRSMTTRVLLAVLLAALTPACRAPRHAEDVAAAQEALSAAAALETQARFTAREVPLGLEALVDVSAARYAEAERLTARVLEADAAALRADSLYGTALTVRAVALWRLGRHDEALEAARLVVSAAEAAAPNEADVTSPVLPRDEALCRALPTLIQIDSLGRMVATIDREDMVASRERLQEILSGGERCVAELRAVRALPSMRRHPLAAYLAQCECEVALVMKRALGGVPVSVVERAEVDRVERVRAEALAALAESTSAGSKVTAHYESLLPELAR